jgi:uncharacterized protein (DUF608 family)
MTIAGRSRRDFLRLSAYAAGAVSVNQAHAQGRSSSGLDAPPEGASRDLASEIRSSRVFNSNYEGIGLSQIAFPLGGMGAGMICLEGTGTLSKFSLRHRPDLTNEPKVFAALSIKGPHKAARVLEGPVPEWKRRPIFGGQAQEVRGNCRGLPRFRHATFEARFPFATVGLRDEDVPLEVKLTGWSPFEPGDADNASLPVAGLEYQFFNHSDSPVEAVFSFHAENIMAEIPDLLAPKLHPLDRVLPTAGGFVLYGPGDDQKPWDEGYFAVWIDDPSCKVNHQWFRGGLGDSMRIVWRDIEAAAWYARDALPDAASPGASAFVPFSVAPGEQKTITVKIAWYVPRSNLFEPKGIFREGKWTSYPQATETYAPWYAARFANVQEVITYWQTRYEALRNTTDTFMQTFYNSTLPPAVLEAVAANLTVLKSPTVLRQTDGRLWAYEGSDDSTGSAYGSSTHVWNYAQAVAHLFPDLERSLRETEFGPSQSTDGHQYCRVALPIRPVRAGGEFVMLDAADGQLGGIIKVYRDWRISGDTGWLRHLWPKIRGSLDYCIRTWDPRRRGWIEEPHLNTYDVEFWGPDSMCSSLYLGALKAAFLMGQALNESAREYSELLSRGAHRLENELFNGEFFFQKIEWRDLHSSYPRQDDVWSQLFPDSPEGLTLAQKEGPRYQYGQGCLSDGLLGMWLCSVCGVGAVIDEQKVRSHLNAVHRHNFKRDLTDHVNVMRAVFAEGEESGLLLCTWPRGGKPSLPFFYADEVWSGTEYQVAAHLISLGRIPEGLEIVEACRRRYDGCTRNPFAEVEAGHWYARALSSYSLLQSFSGARFDAVEKVLYLRPAITGDFRCFLSTATGFGTVGVRDGKPFVQVVSGEIPFAKIDFVPAASSPSA